MLSERAALMKKAVDAAKIGQVLDARVTSITDFGAFCAIKDPSGDLNG